jgi:uncharacterized membrane protein YkvI
MQELISARFNIYWYLSFLAPAIIMLAVTYRQNKKLLVVGVIVSPIATYLLCNLAVQEKWQTRNQLAQTEEEMSYATADGANLVFTAFFIGPFESILYTSLWGMLGWRSWPKIKAGHETKT